MFRPGVVLSQPIHSHLDGSTVSGLERLERLGVSFGDM